MIGNIVDFENAGISVCSNKGDIMTVQDGVMESHFLTGDPEWVAITAGEAIVFFEEIASAQIIKDDFNLQKNN